MRVLIIEDDELIGDGLQAGLSALGFACDWLRDGKQGLAGIGAANARNLYASTGYFAGSTAPAAKAFLDRFNQRFSAQAPGLSTLTESVYEGFLMLQAIATKAKSLDVAKMDAASEGASYQGPRGTVTMRARHVEQDVFVADVTDKGFRVVKTFPRIGAGQTCKV